MTPPRAHRPAPWLLAGMLLVFGCTARDWKEEFRETFHREPRPRTPPKKLRRARIHLETLEGGHIRIEVQRQSDDQYRVRTSVRPAGRDFPRTSRDLFDFDHPLRPTAALALHESIQRGKKPDCPDEADARGEVSVGNKDKPHYQVAICPATRDVALVATYLDLLPEEHEVQMFSE